VNASNVTIRDNVFRGAIADAIQIDQNGIGTQNNIWIDNNFLDNPVRQGFVPYTGTNILFTNNIINMSPNGWGRPIDMEPTHSSCILNYFEVSGNWLNEADGWCAINASGSAGSGNYFYFVNNVPCGTSPSTSKCSQSATSGASANGFGPGFWQKISGATWGSSIIYSPNTGCTGSACSCGDSG
jgi:hypothetical protein